MRVLVTWGSKRGGTQGIGETLAAALRERGYEVIAEPVEHAPEPASFDAVIVGGALYANRWPAPVRSFVRRHAAALRERPVWFFSSGPLDDSADRDEIFATREVAALGERIGIQAHATFGGRLAPDASGFPASAMAKRMSGDFRNPARVRGWAETIAAVLPSAQPRAAVFHPACSVKRLLEHGLLGAVACASIGAALASLGHFAVTATFHALAAPLLFTWIAHHYFRARGAREPLFTGLVWAALTVTLDLAVAALLEGVHPLFWIVDSVLPGTLALLATWLTGSVMATLPWPRPDDSTVKGGSSPQVSGR